PAAGPRWSSRRHPASRRRRGRDSDGEAQRVAWPALRTTYMACPTGLRPLDSLVLESIEVSPLSEATRRVGARGPMAEERAFTVWSRGHALVTLAGVVAAALVGAAWPLSLVALLSSAELLRRGWGAFTPAGAFGLAN